MVKELGCWAALAALGCASYEPQPLSPPAELAALDRRGLADGAVSSADGLTEAQLIAIALKSNPELAAQRLEIGAAQALLLQAGLWPDPELGLGWRPGLGGAPGVGMDVELLGELSRPGERAARRDAAEEGIAEARARIIAAEWRVVRETRVRLLALRSRAQAIALLEAERDLREQALELVRRRRAIGEGTELDEVAAALEAAEIRRDLRRAETEREGARLELNRILGRPPHDPVPLAPSDAPFGFTVIEDLPDEELDRRLLAGRFELRALEAAYRRAEDELRLAVIRQYPALRLGPSFGKEPEGGGPTSYLGLGAALELPIFDRHRGEIALKEAERQRARAEYVAVLHGLRAEAYEARERLRRARTELEAQDTEVLPLLRRGQELAEAAFQARELGVLDWVAAQQRTLRARQAQLEAQERYQTAVIDFEAATGRPLTPAVSERKE